MAMAFYNAYASTLVQIGQYPSSCSGVIANTYSINHTPDLLINMRDIIREHPQVFLELLV
jgi:hypothetical protein